MVPPLSKMMGAGLLLILLLPGPALAGGEAEETCLKNLSSLKKKQDFVNQLGGFWGLFEQSPVLRDHSSKAFQLDSKINELIWIGNYLCETLEGVPPNGLARYINQHIKAKGKKQFRKELRALGISHGEIDEWFKFSDFTFETMNRKLDADSVNQSIDNAENYLDRYKELAEKIKASPSEEHLQRALELTRDINTLETEDANLALGLWETHQVPRWDFDGSVGGS